MHHNHPSQAKSGDADSFDSMNPRSPDREIVDDVIGKDGRKTRRPPRPSTTSESSEDSLVHSNKDNSRSLTWDLDKQVVNDDDTDDKGVGISPSRRRHDVLRGGPSSMSTTADLDETLEAKDGDLQLHGVGKKLRQHHSPSQQQPESSQQQQQQQTASQDRSSKGEERGRRKKGKAERRIVAPSLPCASAIAAPTSLTETVKMGLADNAVVDASVPSDFPTVREETTASLSSSTPTSSFAQPPPTSSLSSKHHRGLDPSSEREAFSSTGNETPFESDVDPHEEKEKRKKNESRKRKTKRKRRPSTSWLAQTQWQ